MCRSERYKFDRITAPMIEGLRAGLNVDHQLHRFCLEGLTSYDAAGPPTNATTAAHSNDRHTPTGRCAAIRCVPFVRPAEKRISGILRPETDQ
jgi:hypothetical protein